MKDKNSISAETLGQIALIQSMVVHLPDKEKILNFVCEGLKEVPGVDKVECCMYEDAEDKQKPQAERNGLLKIFIIKLDGKEHGCLRFSLSDFNLFAPYIPFIENLANMLAVIFEERRQRILNESIMRDLENRINGRTKELKKEIEEHCLAEQVILTQKNNFEQLFVNSPIAIAIMNQEDQIIQVNQSFSNLFGHPSEEAVGRDLCELLVPVEFKEEGLNLSKVVHEGTPVNKESYRKKKDGSLVFVQIVGIPIIIDSKDIGIYAMYVDLSRRKKAEEELKDSEAKYRTLFNNIADPVFIYRKKTHNFLDSNQAVLDFYGYTIDELRKMTPVQLHPEEEWERVNKNLDKKDHDDHSYTHIKKNGEKVFVDIRTTEVNYQGKEAWISTIRDATLRKKAEKIIIESQRLSAIGEMSSAVAHDFNNSLQSIFGNLELALLNPDIPDRVRKYLEIIRSSTRDAATRVQMLQRFGGKKQANTSYSLLSLNDVVKDVVVQSRPLWKDSLEKEGRIITIKTSYGRIPKILGNDGELRAVLYNIVKNSIEAMPDGGTIFLETGKKEEGVYVGITDTGIGMDDETKSRIFQPFFSTKGFEIGRGLGMSGAYSIMLEHEGKIYITRSAPGEGTAIEIILPYPPKDELKDLDEKKSDYEGSASVLWVEDDKMIREVAAEMIECLGHTGDVVGSGLEALECLEQKKYDLVITDIGMPGMSGWQLADKIKTKYNGKMKVAVLTGWGAQIDDNKKKEHGVGFILGKPFNISQLEKLIGEALQVDPNQLV